MNIMDGVGIIGALLLAFCGLPQAVKSMRDGHSLGLSHWFVWMWFWGEVLTVIYVYQKHGFDIPLFTNYLMNIIIILVIIKYKYLPTAKNLVVLGYCGYCLFGSLPVLQAQEALPLPILKIQQAIIEDYQLPVEKKVIEAWQEKTSSAASPDTASVTGAQKVELMRQQQKALLAAKKAAAREKSRPTDHQGRQDQQEQWMAERGKELSGWMQQRQETINRWQTEKAKFAERIPEYVGTLTPLEEMVAGKSASTNFKNRFTKKVQIVELPIFSETFYVNGAFAPAIKDQGARPTCAAFATIRAVEILAAQLGKPHTFSEQYFYWASRPDCQQAPCTKRGSWPLPALQRAQKSGQLDLPLANQCPYRPTDIVDNQTQLPLAPECFEGKAKIKRFSSTKDFGQVGRALKNNLPVVGGFYLSDSFYQNNGYVFLSSKAAAKRPADQHRAGHVLLIVGQMSLPSSLVSQEGKYCLIVANSWGEGFGQGGYSCLSEKWLLKYHYSKVPFLVLEEIEVAL